MTGADTATKPLQFNGSVDEYEKYLDTEVANGNLSNEVADAMFAAFVQLKESNHSAPSLQETLTTPPTIEELASFQQSIVENDPLNGQNIGGYATEELQRIGGPTAQAELAVRQRFQDQTFLQNLSDPDYLLRINTQVVKSIPTTANAIVGLGPLVGTGFEALTGLDTGAKEELQQVADRQEEINKFFGAPTPETIPESIAESITGAIVPGGLLAKAGGVGTDFVVDQTIRELTDQPSEKYETIFDKAGVPETKATDTLTTVALVGGTILGGSVLTSTAVKRMKASAPETPTFKALTDIEKGAPEGIFSVEKASDATKAYTLSDTDALKDVLKRNGIPAFDDVVSRIDSDTHSAARTKVNNALSTGKMFGFDKSFQSEVAPRILYDAYHTLPTATKKDVADYIKLRDLRDDIVIGIDKGQATNTQLFDIDQRIATIEKSVPEAKEFSSRYNKVTKALRDYSEGSLYSSEYKTLLDKTRPNYVPLEITNVDVNAPLTQRLKQAQVDEGEIASAQWLQHNREINASRDIANQIDPFDLLIDNTEATLTARMKNDTKVAIVDNLLEVSANSDTPTIRLVKNDETINDPSRLITVYRNGKKETYVTSKLTAQIARFDPYTPKWAPAFAIKRLSEVASVGPLTMVSSIGGFAPTTFLRDSVAGLATRPDKLVAATPFESLAVIPEVTTAKIKNFARIAYEESLISKGPDNALSKLAKSVADGYEETLYAQTRNAGGFGGADIKTISNLQGGMLKELSNTISRNIEDASNPAIQKSLRSMKTLSDGLVAMFETINEAPRYAAVKKTVAAGEDVATASRNAKELTGNPLNSGRSYVIGDSRVINADAVDNGILDVANKGIGITTQAAREVVPFFTPMVKGTERLFRSIVDDPIAFNQRAWLNIGLPTIAFFGWNEMLGKEYNQYAFERRSATDAVMTQYIGVPGLPPEQGIEIPLAHEVTMFSAPFTRALHGLFSNETNEETRAAVGVLAKEILSSSTNIDAPVVLNMIDNARGVKTDTSSVDIASGTINPRVIYEDEVGLLPENLEATLRTVFGAVGNTTAHLLNAIHTDASPETFFTEMKERMLSRTPIVKNVTGRKTGNIYFSVPNQQHKKKIASASKAIDYYNSFVDPDRFFQGLEKSGSRDYYNSSALTKEDFDADLPFLSIVPDPRELKNPLIKKFGDVIKETMNERGGKLGAYNDRSRVYSGMVFALQEYNSGHKEKLERWQTQIEQANTELTNIPALQSIVNDHLLVSNNRKDAVKQEQIYSSPEVISAMQELGYSPSSKRDRNNFLKHLGMQQEIVEMQKLLLENDIDLSTFQGRTKAINLINHKNADLLKLQIDIVKEAEDALSKELGISFDATKHLNPSDPNPLGIQAQ